MERREFFKLLGLGTGGILVLPSLFGAAWTDNWQAEEAVKFAIDFAQKQGALYADAHIGPCEIQGKIGEFQPQSLLKSDLLGMRICTEAGWHHVVLRDFGKEAITEDILQVTKIGISNGAQEGHWVTAHFDHEQILAQGSSHPDTERELNRGWLRYAQRPQLPRNGQNILFCDLILAH